MQVFNDATVGGMEDPFAKFSPEAINVVKLAVEKARLFSSPYVDPDHVALALVEDSSVFNLIEKAGSDAKKIQDEIYAQIKRGEFTGDPQFSSKSKKILSQASTFNQDEGAFVSPFDILKGLLADKDTVCAKVFADNGISEEKVEEFYKKIVSEQKSQAAQGNGEGEVDPGDMKRSRSVLDIYTTDLTQKARDGKLDPVIARDKEIERVMEIISRRTKNNPVLVGEAGVGKTAIVEGLAQKIAKGDVPAPLKDKKLLMLDLSLLVAGAAHRGEFEQRMQQLLKELKSSEGQIILFIDEVHTIVGAGAGEGALDASNILKPPMSRGEIQVIGATTVKEYRQYIEQDAAFERRFQKVMVNEPLAEDAVKMVEGIKAQYEEHHKVKIPTESVEAAVKLSQRFISDRFLPDKAIDVVDESCAKVVLKNINPAVATEDVVKEVVSDWSGVPVSRLSEDESAVLLKLEDKIHERYVDQEPAVGAVCEAIRRNRAGLKNPKRPIGSFIFMGPTGVGKTELAKTLAEVMFGAEDKMVRLDMSEYMEKNSTARMIGAPPGYVGYEEGGQLTEAVRKTPYCVVLFDEIEKAHKEVFNIFLQILDDGRLTDNKGRTVDFKNTIIICTSNIGTELIRQSNITDPKTTKMVMDELLKEFRPEFVNRFDDISVFRALMPQDMALIVDVMVKQMTKLLSEQKIAITISEPAKTKLGELGFDPVYGARPLRRVLQKQVENPLSTAIIKGEVKEGQTVSVDLGQDGNFTFRAEQGAKQAVSPEVDKDSDHGGVIGTPNNTNEEPPSPSPVNTGHMTSN